MTCIKIRNTVIENMIRTFATTEEFYEFIISTNTLSGDIAHCSEKTRTALESNKKIGDIEIVLMEFEKLIYLCLFLRRNMDLLMPMMKEFHFEPYDPNEPLEEDDTD